MDFVSQEEFFDRLNDYVFEPNFGKPLSRQKMRDVLGGIADVIVEIVMSDGSVRLGKMGTFKPHIKPPGRGWDPRRRRHFKCPGKKKIAFKMSKSTMRLFGL